ncbi:unnamed protein product [Oreochromis niloticus]|nr:unnamed protein product [Mustela putorius furo]
MSNSTINSQWSGPGKSFDEDDDEIEEEIIDDIEENCENNLEEDKSDHLYKFEKEKSEFENEAEKSKESEKSGDFWDAPKKQGGDSSAHDHFEEEFTEESEGAAGFQEDPVSVDKSEMGYEYDCEEHDGPEKSETSAGLLKQLEEDKLALQKELEIEKEAKSQQEEAFKKLQEENDRLENAVKKERDELKRMKTKVADLKKSQKEHRSSTEDLKTRISQMMANTDEDKKTIKKLHKDLMMSSLKHENEDAEAADIKALEDRLIEQQKQNLGKDDEIQSLRLKVQNLQDDSEAKDTMILRLQENVNEWASDVQKEQEKNSELQRSYDSIVSQEHGKTQKLNRLTSENQDLSSENQTLRDEVEFLKNERQLMQKDLDEEKGARRELEKTVKEEKSQFSQVYKKLQMKEKELSEKTLAPPGQRRTSKSAEHLLYDMETLKMENANLTAKLEAMENQYSGAKFKHEALPEQHRDKLLQNVDELEARQSERDTVQKELEITLKEKKNQTSQLQQRVGALEKELKISEKQRSKFEDVLAKYIETLEEKQELSVTFQKSQDSTRVQEQKISDNEHKIALDQCTKALYNLQKEYIDLAKKHSGINDNCRELLKTHTALQIKYDRLTYTKENQN